MRKDRGGFWISKSKCWAFGLWGEKWFFEGFGRFSRWKVGGGYGIFSRVWEDIRF